MFFLIFFLTDSVEGDGDVLSDSGARKAGHTEGALLQVALWFSRLFYFSVAG